MRSGFYSIVTMTTKCYMLTSPIDHLIQLVHIISLDIWVIFYTKENMCSTFICTLNFLIIVQNAWGEISAPVMVDDTTVKAKVQCRPGNNVTVTRIANSLEVSHLSCLEKCMHTSQCDSILYDQSSSECHLTSYISEDGSPGMWHLSTFCVCIHCIHILLH